MLVLLLDFDVCAVFFMMLLVLLACLLVVSAVPPGLRPKDLATETTTMSAQKGSNAFFSSPLAACISSLA